MNTIEEAIKAAQENGGILVRDEHGAWHGQSEVKPRFDSVLIARMVKEGKATYTKFKEPSPAAAKAYKGLEKFRGSAVEVTINV